MKKISKFLVPVVIISLLMLNLVAVAAPKIEEVKAYVNYGINMKLNGKAFEPKESDGTSLRPLVYKNRTYLPVAALGKALDVDVNWDGATGTVIIGENNDKMTDFMSIVTGMYDIAWKYTTDKAALYANGETFDSGLVLIKDYNYISADYLKFNTKNKYSKIGFTVGTDSTVDFSFSVMGGENEVLKDITVSDGSNQNIEVDIQNHDVVWIKANNKVTNKPNSTVVFGDIYFK